MRTAVYKRAPKAALENNGGETYAGSMPESVQGSNGGGVALPFTVSYCHV